ncbi:hypothetical protein NC651_010108 [Populus alba x Populus x berolinensis]|nr:hypothetical protein NC651_010108 [Populus alba x Populus x berolinensis]
MPCINFLLISILMFIQNIIMTRHALLAMCFLIILLSMLFALVLADPLLKICSTTEYGGYDQKSPFGKNMKIVLETLPSITSSTGYNSTAVGEFPDKVTGKALCRGDVTPRSNWKIGIVALAACALVVVIVIVIGSCIACLLKERGQQRGVERSHLALLQELACPRGNITSLDVYAGKYPDLESHNKSVSDPVHFYDNVRFLMDNLSNEVAFNRSKLMFETGEIKFSRNETIYGHVQCTRDIGEDECHKCLSSALIDLKGCCFSKQGGIIVSRNCNVRFELYKYYNTSSHLITFPTPQGRSNWKMVAITVFIPTMVLTLIVIGSSIFCLRRKRRRQRGNVMKPNSQAWRLWIEGKAMEFVDPLLVERGPAEGILRCMHIGLLCVQKDPADRPTMSFVDLALASDPIALPQPQQPAFSLVKIVPADKSSSTDPSVNQMTFSSFLPRERERERERDHINTYLLLKKKSKRGEFHLDKRRKLLKQQYIIYKYSMEMTTKKELIEISKKGTLK